MLTDVTLVPFGVVSDKVHVEAWWENPETARLLFLEDLKYIASLFNSQIRSQPLNLPPLQFQYRRPRQRRLIRRRAFP